MLAPLVVTFEIKNHGFAQTTALKDDAIVQQLAAHYGLNVLVRANGTCGRPFVVVKGSVLLEQAVRQAVLTLQQHFMNLVCSSKFMVF